MKTLLLLLMFSLAPLAHAQIYSSVEATSNTGGNSAGEGEVITTGNANASASSQSYTDEEGEVEVHIKTETNGEVYEETITGESVVEVRAQATPTGSSVTKIEDGIAEVVASSSATTSLSGATEEGASQGLFATIALWFDAVFSFFLW